MVLRNYRPLVVLAALALSSCPFNFKYGVENGRGKIVASAGTRDLAAAPSLQRDLDPSRRYRQNAAMRLRRDATACFTVAEILALSPGTCVDDRRTVLRPTPQSDSWRHDRGRIVS